MEAQYGSAGNLARLFAYVALLVFAAVTLAWPMRVHYSASR
jgi:hypothetical protein